MCDFAVLCELWWGSAAPWSQLCEWAGFGCNAKQPLWENFQTRNTQEVQYAGMQDQHRFVHNAMSMTLQYVFLFVCSSVWFGFFVGTSESCPFSSRSSLQEEYHVLSLLWQAEAFGSLLSQVGPETVLCHLRVIARVTHPHVLQWTHPNYSNTYCMEVIPSADWHVQTKVLMTYSTTTSTS